MADNPITDALNALQGHAQNAAKPEVSEPGPGDVGPSTQTKGVSGLVTLPMEPDEITKWWARVTRAEARVKAREEQWDILLNEYLPNVTKSGEAETVKVQQHFRNVHSKIGQLFYRSPDLVLLPRDPGPANNQMPNPMAQLGGPPAPPLTMEDIVSVKQQVLTETLGRDGIKANRLMDELLFDVLAWSGVGCSKLGYRGVMKPVPQASPVMGGGSLPAPVPAGGSLGAAPVVSPPTGAPQIPPPMVQPGAAPAPLGPPQMVPIFEEYYWRRFSPKKWLCNDDLRSTRYDEDATWQGMKFFMSQKAAMSGFNLTPEEAAKSAVDDRVHEYPEDKQGGSATLGLVEGVEIWCKASIFTDELNPEVINQLVLIKGITDKVFVWRPSPDQTIDPATGRLTDDSLRGFPIRILTIRDLADSCFPQSDSAFTNSEIKQLSTWRRQSIKIRDAAIGKYFYDMDAFDEMEVDLLKNGEVGAYIGVMGGKLAQGADKVFTTSAQIHATQDDYRGAELIQRDVNETLGISSNQAGNIESTVRSATETATVQAAVTARNEKELGRVVDFYLDGARMIDSLLMRYADQNAYTHIVGQDGARKLMMWNNTVISGKYLYDIAPDSQMRVDTAMDFKLTLELYNQAAKDPLLNRGYFLRRLVRMRGLDPSKAVLDQSQLPKPAPEKPKVSIALKGEDLLNPSVLMVLESLGLLPPPEPMPGAPPAGVQPPHGGANSAAETISQHSASNSGNRPGEPGAVNHRENQVK